MGLHHDQNLHQASRVARTGVRARRQRIDAGSYGTCETCGKAIPEERLEALPHAALCVTCKSGGLGLRR